jgi:hypothetical protein
MVNSAYLFNNREPYDSEYKIKYTLLLHSALHVVISDVTSLSMSTDQD